MPYEVVITVPGNDPGQGPYHPIYDPVAALGSKLLGFFDARDTDLLTLDGSNNVDVWNSAVGGIAATPLYTSGAQRAVWDADGWDGYLPCVNLSAGSGGVTGSVLRGTGPTNDAGMIAFVVAERGTQLDGASTRFRPIISLPVALESGVRQVGHVGVWAPSQDAAQTSASAGQFTSAGFSNNSNVTPFGVGAKALIEGSFPNSDNIKARLNGGIQGAAKSYYDVPSSPTTAWCLGGFNAVDGAFAGKLASAIVVKASITTDERQSIEGYLAWSWGLQASLPIDHPYRNDGPYSA